MTQSLKTGNCHCGAVQWQAMTDDTVIAEACNCSICQMTGFQHLIVPANRFTLLKGQNQLAEYSFNTGVAKHFFCKICGVKSFYMPRSNPDGVSLNLRCMDPDQFEQITLQAFDGQNWEENAGRLAALSKADE